MVVMVVIKLCRMITKEGLDKCRSCAGASDNERRSGSSISSISMVISRIGAIKIVVVVVVICICFFTCVVC